MQDPSDMATGIIDIRHNSPTFVRRLSNSIQRIMRKADISPIPGCNAREDGL
jgi:hypothetical protein